MENTDKLDCNYFYSHFEQDSATRIGGRLVDILNNRVFKFAQIPPNGCVLEIGPGKGQFADLCLKNKITYYAIEPNMKMAEELKKRGAQVIVTTVPPLPPMDRKFDCVIMISVMEHMNTMNEALQTVSQIKGILKSGGKIVIHSPDYINWRHNFYVSDFSHNYVTTRPRLTSLLLSAGFTNIKSTHVSGIFTGFWCFLVSAIAARLPFVMLDAIFPGNKLIHKLYKLQSTFLRTVIISAQAQEQEISG